MTGRHAATGAATGGPTGGSTGAGLAVQEVAHGYGGGAGRVEVLHDVSLAVAPGERGMVALGMDAALAAWKI